MAANFDREEVLRTWQIFRQTGEVVELRIPKAGRYKTISGYFNDPSKFVDAVVGLADGPFAGIYFTINSVKPDLLARASNRCVKYAETTTNDADIIALHWLLVDLDAKRPSGISATDGEHNAAITKANEIRTWLIETLAWPASAFVLADSGNGSHLDVMIDLPNVPECVNLVRNCLGALDSKFSDNIVHVDTTTFNPSRIMKIYGTRARKGDSTKDRPHRLAKLLEVPESLETVSRVLLESLAKLAPKDSTHAHQKETAYDSSAFDVEKYVKTHGGKVKRVSKKGQWTAYELEECPFDSSHNRGEAIVSIHDNGAKAFKCHHDSCKGRDWYALRDLWEPDRRKKAEDKLNVLEMSEEEFNAFKLPDGPKFECNLPKDNFLQRFMAYGYDVSDAYPDYWFAGGVFALAVVADKKIKVTLRQMTVYPNLYVSLLGKSSLARKSTAIDKAEALLDEIWPFLVDAKVPTEFSPEAFIEHMDEHNHAPWIRDEAAGVLSLMKKDYMRGFKDSLLSLYDCKSFHRKLRTSQRKGAKTDFKVDDPYLNMLWATTGASFGANTDLIDTLSGFLARFIFFYPQGQKARWLPLEKGSTLKSDLSDVVRSQLIGIATKMVDVKSPVDMDVSPEANAFWANWQKVQEDKWTTSNDDFNEQIFSRMNPVVVKLSMLFELGSPDFDPARPKPIRLEFLQEACRLVDTYLMPTSRAVYDLVGSNVEKNIIDRIVAYLKNHNGKATAKEIMKNVKIKKADFDDFLDTMVEAEMVKAEIVRHAGKAGRPSMWVFLIDQPDLVGNVYKVDKVDIVDIVAEDLSDSKRDDLETISTKSTKSTNSTNSKHSIKVDLQRAEEQTKAKEEHFKTPSKSKEIVCAVCGADLASHGRIEKSGLFYCALPGCGYPARGEEAA